MNGSVASPSSSPNDGVETYVFLLPCIVIFGLVGNVVSLVTIFHSRLRKVVTRVPIAHKMELQVPANQYLILLTVADSVFLLGLCLVLFKVDYLAFELCVGIEYLLMSSSYVSSWSIAAITIERYMAIAHPLTTLRKWGHVNRAIVMLFWVPVPFIINIVQLFVLIPYGDPSYADERKCEPRNGSLPVMVEIADVLLCYVMPCVAVVVLNLLVAGEVSSSARGFGGAERRSSPPNSTRILFVVPSVYLLLNTPFYMFRIAETVALNVFNSRRFSIHGGLDDPLTVFAYNAAHYLYYVNFACDVVVYAFSSSNFRRTVVVAWSRLLCPKWEAEKALFEKTRSQVPSRHQTAASSFCDIHRHAYTPIDGNNDEGTSTRRESAI